MNLFSSFFIIVARCFSKRSIVICSILAFFSFLLVDIAYSTETPEQVEKQAGFDQKLNTEIDLNLRFKDQTGTEMSLRDMILDNRPVVIVPVYYECPRLCGLTLDGVTALLNELDLKLGTDYRVLTVTFDPNEGVDLAAERSNHYQPLVTDQEHVKEGWRFLTGTKANVDTLIESIGFKFIPDSGEFSHAAGLVLVTPRGVISRYFFGVLYPTKDVRYSLIEAAQGRIGGIADKIFLYCFRYDHLQGKYSLAIWNMTRAICLVVVFAIALFLVTLRRREIKGVVR